MPQYLWLSMTIFAHVWFNSSIQKLLIQSRENSSQSSLHSCILHWERSVSVLFVSSLGKFLACVVNLQVSKKTTTLHMEKYDNIEGLGIPILVCWRGPGTLRLNRSSEFEWKRQCLYFINNPYLMSCKTTDCHCYLVYYPTTTYREVISGKRWGYSLILKYVILVIH